jgi:surface antigen
MKKTIVVSLIAVALVGCANVNNEGVGTVTGGVVGGLIGSQFGSGVGKVAAAAGGALVGAMIGGKLGQYMDRQDQMQMQWAMETAPTGRAVHWVNPDNGNQFTVTTKRTYYAKQQPCREYVTNAMIGGKSQQVYGHACRQADGSWRIQN